MPGGMDSTGLAVGLKKGFIVEKRKLPVKPSTRKGVRALASPPVPGLRAIKPLGEELRCRTLRGAPQCLRGRHNRGRSASGGERC